MRRGRGKRKRQNATAREDGDEEEEKIPAYRRRGRPQKPLKDETEGEREEIAEKDDDNTNGSETSKEDVTENGRKGKKPVEESKESNVTEEENVLGSKSSADDSVKSSLSMGFRHVGSRRKNKPRRAAEAVVECNGV